MPEAPTTVEGWYMLHDFRAIDWDAWRDAPERRRETALAEGRDYLQSHEAVEDAPEGESATFTVLGHEADLLVIHARPTLDALDRAERCFETTAFASFTERTDSYVSVTEVSDYVSDEYFAEDEEADPGLVRYIEGKLEPEIPDDTYVSFYPMDRRRDPDANWYTLPFEERAEMMAEHGDTGREYGGRVRQVIASSVGLDDWEWGVTLFAEDPVDLKDIVYEMRFDEASAEYSDFGRFLVGKRFPPADLGSFMAGEAVPAEGEGHHETTHGESDEEANYDHDEEETADEGDIRGELADLDIYAGQPHGEDVYATVLYSEADPDDLFEEVDGLRGNFEHYDTHVKTAVYEALDADRGAVVSIWETASAADTAAGFLADLPDVVPRAEAEEGSGFGTMGMFYETKPEHRADFVETFESVEDLLVDMDGHVETDLMVNVEDENDMFIASQWDAKEDAMAFFRSDEFSETVAWGRDVLVDRPRHVFLA
ncbi:MAG: heme-binding protein [Halobacteriaceae archaeon]